MTRFVIDAPTLLRVVSDDVAVHPDHRLVAPNGLRSQALALLLAAVRGGDLTDRAALELHERMTEVKVRLLGDRVSRRTAWTIARENDWDALDLAEYLAVTRLQADAFVTVDAGSAATAADLVPLAPFEALVRPPQ